MKRETLLQMLNDISEENLVDGIDLADPIPREKRRKKARLTRTILLSGVAALLICTLIIGVLLQKTPPIPSQPPATEPSSPKLQSVDDFPDTTIPVEIRRFEVDGVSYVSFTPTEDILTVCNYMDKSLFTMPEYIPASFRRTDCMPFQSMDNMVNIALSSDTIPLWLASYLLVNFTQDEHGIALPDRHELYLPTLPENFYCGLTYMLTGNYRVQVRSHYFTNGLFDAFSDYEEYAESLSDAHEYLYNNPEVIIRNIEEYQTEDLSQKIVTYSEDGIRYVRVESTFSKNGKTFHTFETYPQPYIGGDVGAEDTVYPESLIVYVEQNGLYGWFYLTQFGKEMTIDDIAELGLEQYQPKN